MSKLSTRWVVVAGVVVALILAGIVSFYASGSPDGLNRVAQDKGFSSTETEHGAADGPFAGYATKGIDDERLSGGLAGVAGSLMVLAIAGGVALMLRRRNDAGPSRQT